MKTIKFHKTLTSKQNDFIGLKTPINLFTGGVGTGKTIALMFKGLELALSQPRLRISCCMWTYPQIRDVMIPAAKDVLSCLPRNFWTYQQSGVNGHSIDFVNGSTWLFRHLEQEEKVRGSNLDVVLVDELTVGISKGKFDQLTARLRNGRVDKIYATTNAGRTNHWVYKYFITDPNVNVGHVSATTYENPFLPASYLKLLETHSESWKDQFMRCIWGSTEGLIYPAYDPAVHVVDFEWNPAWVPYRGVDFGWEHSFCALFAGYDPRDGTFWIIAEHHRGERLMSAHVDKFLEQERSLGLPRPRRTYVDPSGGQLKHELADLLKKKAKEKYVWDAKNDVAYGIEKVRQMLETRNNGKPRLFIHPRCGNLCTGMSNYEKEPVREDMPNKDKPRKVADDAVDTLKYIIASVARQSQERKRE